MDLVSFIGPFTNKINKKLPDSSVTHAPPEEVQTTRQTATKYSLTVNMLKGFGEGSRIFAKWRNRSHLLFIQSKGVTFQKGPDQNTKTTGQPQDTKKSPQNFALPAK